MAGQRIPLRQLVRGALTTFRKHRDYGDREIQTYAERFDFLSGFLTRHTGRSVSEARVLEVGCGQRALMPLLFAARGAEAHALDVERPTYDLHAFDFLRILKENGPDRALKSLLRHVLFDRVFFRDLGAACGVGLTPFPRVAVHVGDAARFNLPQSHFDMVFSFAVLEHVLDVKSTVKTMNAVLKSDGVGFVVIHLFPSLTGGHCMDWQYALDPTYPEWGIPADVPPWDHLREYRYPADTYLNRLRLADYRRFFHEETEIVAEERTLEGVELLSLAPRELLQEYSHDDLTTTLVSYTFHKRADARQEETHV
jgi:SAM-dependent methyltransferase